MFNLVKWVILWGLVGSQWALAAERSPTQWLEYLDELRVGQQTVLINTQVQLYKSDKLTSEKLYDVYVGQNNQSLAVFKSHKERGQKVLMKGDDYWLQMPTSKRRIRISPMQKLLGDASTGDIAQLRWSQDYQVIGQQTQNGQLQLSLLGKRKALSYQKIELWFDLQVGYPTHAELYLGSGKMAKRASFTIGTLNGKAQITQMTLEDQILSQQKTVVRYLEVQPITLPAQFFNPSYLTRAGNL